MRIVENLEDDLKAERFSKLSPLTIETKTGLTRLAIHFFSGLNNGEMCKLVGKSRQDNEIQALSAFDFLNYLDKTKAIPEASRYYFPVLTLLKDLANADILYESFPRHYLFMKELTTLQRKGYCWYSKALGAEYIHSVFASQVLHITGIDKDGNVVAGTGIAIDDHWVLTCAHVLNDMEVDRQQWFSGSEYSVLNTYSHQSIDVGLIQVDKPLPCIAGLSFTDPVVGSSIFTIGYPRIPLATSAEPVMHRGEVTVPKLTTLDKKELFLFSAIARPGNSGGPIVSEDGTVIGIVTEELSEQSTRSGLPFYAGVPTDQIARAIQELNLHIKFPIEDYQ